MRSSHIVSIRTRLKSRLIWDWSAVIHTISASRSSLYVYIRAKWEDTSYVPYISPLLSDVVWYLSGHQCMASNCFKIKKHFKLDKVDKTRCTWPFQAKNRYDVTLANRRAPGVWFVLGCKVYLFLAPRVTRYTCFWQTLFLPRLFDDARSYA